jgi:hypothetical protein
VENGGGWESEYGWGLICFASLGGISSNAVEFASQAGGLRRRTLGVDLRIYGIIKAF